MSLHLQKIEKLPSNGVEFTRNWTRHCTTNKEKYDFLLQVGAHNLAKIFKSEISFGHLADMLEVMMDFEEVHVTQVVAILESLSQTGRFGLSLQFMSSKEKENCSKLFEKLDSTVTFQAESELQGKLQNLIDVYEIRK